MAKMLISSGADIRKQEMDGNSVLHQPGRNGSLELCELLLSNGANPSAADNNGITPMMVACIEGRVPILQALMKHVESSQSAETLKMALNAQDNDGAAPLHHATQNHRAEVVKILLEAGVNVNVKRNDGNSSLHIAASLGHGDLVALLLQHGADPAALDRRRRTPLHECGLSNQSHIAQLLIEQAADVNAADDQFMTPLHWAARRGHLAVADILLAAAARLNCRDVCMRTPLHWAVIEDRDSMVERLLREPGIEAVFDKQDMHEKAPLHYAAERGCLDLTQQLVKRGADVCLADADERRPAHVAAKRGHLGCLRLLISATGHVDRSMGQRDLDESTTLLLAAEDGRIEVFRYLIDNGADFNAKDEIGRNALMLAVSKSHYDIAKLLLDKDIDVNATDVSKNTALHYAAKEPNAGDCVKLLLEYSALITENCNQETPVDFAIRVQSKEALDVFFGSDRWSWTMAYRRSDGRTHMDRLIESAPEYATKILDYCIGNSVRDPLDKNFMVIYNFALLDPGPDDVASQPNRYFALRTMAKSAKLGLLNHPLTSAMLQLRWNIVRFFMWIDLLCYFCFVTCLTLFIMHNGPLSSTVIDPATGCRNDSTGMRPKLTDGRLVAEKSFILAFLVIRLFVEVVKILHKKQYYFLNTEVYCYLILYGVTLAFIWPPDSEPCMWNWVCGLISILMAWSLILFQIEYIPHVGLHSLMFQKVLISLLKVLHVFSFLIMAFALTFYSVMKDSEPFSTLPLAILKTFDMTVGELELVTYFVSTDYGLFQSAVQALFAIFVIVMPIALVNLLIGIAVGDIDGIMRGAELKLVTIKINLIYELETNLPRFIQRRWYKSHREIYPNRQISPFRRALIGNFEEEYVEYKLAEKMVVDQGTEQTQLLNQQADRISRLEDTLESIKSSLTQLIQGLKQQ